MLSTDKYFELVKSYKLIANKSLGQNFLIDTKAAEEIVSKLEINESDSILEIGAGLGSLSYFLAKQQGHKVLIDIDEKMLGFLQENYGNEPDFEVKRQNILKADLQGFSKIIGNLPYYITSGIIEYLLLHATDAKIMVLMCQKEVYPKLLSTNKSPLSIILNYVCEISSPMNVGRNSFTPVPHVDSVVFTLKTNSNIQNEENKELYKLMTRLFLHRRKTILNCMSAIGKSKEESKEILRKAAISEMLRPEQLSIENYKTLLKVLKS